MKTQYRSYQYLGQQLKELIASGEYPIGSRLMPEREIVKNMMLVAHWYVKHSSC